MKVTIDGISATSTFDYSGISKAISAIALSMSTSTFDYSGISKAINTVALSMSTSTFDYSGISKAINAIALSMPTFDYSAISNTLGTALRDMPKIDFSAIDFARDLAKNLSDIELSPEESNLKGLSENAIEQINSELNFAFSDEKNWQQKFADVMISWKNKNPVIAWLLNVIVLTFIMSLLSDYASSAFTNKKSAIRKEPKANAAVVCNIEINQMVQVVESVAYYHKVEVRQEDSEKRITGWVSKRSLSSIQDERDIGEETE